MGIYNYSVSFGTYQQIDELAEFAFEINNIIEHSSAFCYKDKNAIRREFEEEVTGNHMLVCRSNNEIAGILNYYLDEPKSNADCTLLIDTNKCDYNVVAGLLFDRMKASNKNSTRYTFFFPKENMECAGFLESIHADRQVNEYALILDKNNVKTYISQYDITELPLNYYEDFIELHDTIFPDVYISGADIINDIGKKHFVYLIIKDEVLIAYSVLRNDGGKSATAEIVAVKKAYRGKGYGRAILSFLINKAFTQFNKQAVRLIVDGDNDTAIKLYLDLGFLIENENRCYIA